MNSPITPGQKSMGANAARVVRVEPITGQATSPVARMAALTRPAPCSMKRWMFSTMTMALSTSMPRARVRLNSTTMFRVTPSRDRVVKVSSMEKGMARLTSTALRSPMATNTTTSTSTRPVRMLFSRSATMTPMSLALSTTLVISVPAGHPARRRSITRSISSLMAMMFSPERFFTAMFTASRPSRRARLVSSLKLSVTRATSLR